jgi:5-methylcytosine-specific restriction endonuclease McrA
MAEQSIRYDGPIVTLATARSEGLRHYFTGKPCKSRHIDQRFTSTRGCRACLRESNKKRLANPRTRGGLLAKKKAYRESERGKAERLRYQRIWSKSENGRKAIRMHVRLTLAKRRARASDGDFTTAEARKMMLTQKRCHICGKRFTKADPATFDHVVALANGGPHTASNIALAHRSCNRTKNAKTTHLI